jgi:hypothetical protein
MPDERPVGGGGSDPYGGGYSFGPFSGGQPSGETTQPTGWQPGAGQRGGSEPTQPLPWQPSAGQVGTEPTQPMPWAPVASSGPEAMQIGRYGAPTGGPPPSVQPGPPPGTPPPRRQNRLLIMAAVVIAALVLTGVGVGIAVTSGRTGSGSPTQAPTRGASNPASQDPTAAPAGALASNAVRGYLEAIAAGNATAALAYSAQPPPQSNLLTDAVLAESKRRAPITAIDVPAVDDQTASTVTANYKIGSTSVSHTYQVQRIATDQWKLISVTAPVEIDYHAAPGMKINGAKINSSLLELFPGSYAITGSSKYVTVGSVKFVVKGAGADLDRHRTPASLTKAGKKLATNAAKKDLKRCLGTRTIAPKNCPFGVRSNGFKNNNSTIRWTVVGKDPFAKAKLKLVEKEVVVSSISIRLRFSSSCSRNGVPYICHADINNTAWATVPLAKPKKVRWSAAKR